MRRVVVLVASILISVASSVSWGDDRGGAVSYSLLAAGGLNMKWGTPDFGTPAVIRYAFLDRTIERPIAQYCRRMGPLPPRLNSGELPFRDFAAEIHAAFAAWQRVVNVTFEHVENVARADVVIGAQAGSGSIAFADVVYEIPPAASVASIRSGAVCFNPAALWKTGFDRRQGIYDVRLVALHEIGHVLGLDHARGASDTIMGFRYREGARTPQPGDIAGANVLYGSRQTRAAANREAGIRVPDHN